MAESAISHGRLQRVNRMFLKDGAARNAALLQLFLTHGITSGIALALVFIFPWLRSNLPLTISGAVIISGCLGVLLTANLSYQLQRVEEAITCMVRKQRVAQPRFSWPLTRLFTQLDEMDRRMHMYIQGEQAAAEIRRHYLEQASESATLSERQRIARDLHDSIKQQLFSISVSAATAKAYWNKDISQAYKAVADIQRVVKEAQVEMQALLQQLSAVPLKHTKLADALRIQAEALQHRSGLTMDLMLGDIPAAELLPEGTQEMLFRLVQEAFSNIARHARAKTVSLTLRQTEGALHLIISDNGQGFDSNMAHAGMGLTNMRERVAALNGTLELRSALGQGTVLHIQIPFLQTVAQREDEMRVERELGRATEKAHISFLIGYTALMLAVFFLTVNRFVLVQIPVAVIMLCFLCAGYGLVQIRRVKKRLILQRGKEHSSVLPLQKKDDRLFGGIIILFFSYGSWLLFNAGNGFSTNADMLKISIVVIFYCLALTLFVFYCWRLYRTHRFSYSLMLPDEAQLVLNTQRRKLIRDKQILLSAVMIVLVFFGSFASHLNQKSISLADGVALLTAFFSIFVPVALLDLCTFLQMRRVLKEKQQNDLSRSTTLGVSDDRQN